MAGIPAGSTVVDDLSYAAIRPTRLFLVDAHFRDPFIADPSLERGAFLVDLSLSRGSELELTVILTISTDEDSPYELSVSYAADFSMADQVDVAARESIWRNAAYELAPSLLYPYIREAFTSLTSRSRLEPEALPFLPIPLQIPQEEQEIPPPPPDSEYQPEFALAALAAGADENARRVKPGRKGKSKRGGT